MQGHIVFMAIACLATCEPAKVQVWDGDTVWVAGVKYRLAEFDAPEWSHPACSYEAALAKRARERLAQLLASEPFTIEPTGGHSYDRTVATFKLADGRTVRAVLVAEGLAMPVRKFRGWCSR